MGAGAIRLEIVAGGKMDPRTRGSSGPERRFRLSYEHGSPDLVVYPGAMGIAERLEVVLGDCNSGIFSGLDNHTAKTTALPVQG